MNEPAKLGNETALLFVLNRKYVRPLKVLLFSLMEKNSLQGCDIVIATDDRAVADDRFLQRVATSIEFYDEDSLRVFSTIRGDRLQPKSRVAFAPKYTFFKFIGFRERGYRRHLVIDADMLCMNALDEALLMEPYASKAIFEVKGKRFPIRDEDPSHRYGHAAAIRYLEERSLAVATDKIEKINSGFLVLQSEAISNRFFEDAVALASSNAYEQEQAATTHIIANAGSFLRLPMWYNTRRRIFECLGPDVFEAYRDRIFLFHYTPGKPWNARVETTAFIDDPWHAAEARSREWVGDL